MKREVVELTPAEEFEVIYESTTVKGEILRPARKVNLDGWDEDDEAEFIRKTRRA